MFWANLAFTTLTQSHVVQHLWWKYNDSFIISDLVSLILTKVSAGFSGCQVTRELHFRSRVSTETFLSQTMFQSGKWKVAYICRPLKCLYSFNMIRARMTFNTYVEHFGLSWRKNPSVGGHVWLGHLFCGNMCD